MGISMWVASSVLSSHRPGPRYRDDRPLSRSDKWSAAMFIFAFVVVPIIAAVVIVWAMIMAPPQDNSWCARWVGGHCAERAK